MDGVGQVKGRCVGCEVEAVEFDRGGGGGKGKGSKKERSGEDDERWRAVEIKRPKNKKIKDKILKY